MLLKRQQRYLITGGSGFLGIYWASILIKQGHKVTLLLNKKKIYPKNIKTVYIKRDFSFNNFFKKKTFDIIINTASLTDVDLCEKKPNLAKNVHEKFVENLSKASKKHKIYLIHISTDHLFSGNRSFYKETDRTKPLNIYAKTKLKSEKIIKKNLKQYLIIRGNFFGWAPTYKKSFSDWIISSIIKKNKIQVFEDVKFTPLYVLNFIKISNMLINKRFVGLYNVCSSNKISKYKFAKIIVKIFKLNEDFIKKGLIRNSKLTQRPLDMSLSFNKIGKKLKLNRFQYSVLKQIKYLKLDQHKILIKNIRNYK